MQKKQPQVKFVLTAFGEFHGVKDNPTKKLIESLTKEELDSCCIISANVLEVSIQGVDQYVQQMEKNMKCQLNDKTKIVFVHLGVDDSSKNFVLESKGYNQKDFSCPDMRNNTPKKEMIVKHCELDHGLQTNLNLEEVLSLTLKKSKSVTKQEDIFKLGNDPGRYICNYIYFQSLNQLQKLSNCNQTSSLFVHCPPFKKVAKEDQKSLFFILMNSLLKSVQNCSE